MRSWPPLTLGLLAIASVAASTTWQVTFDPGNTVDRIGAVVAQTSDGDTVLVEPGTYYEHIRLPNHTLTILSTAGSETTVLDGSHVGSGSRNSIIFAASAPLACFTLRGVTLRGGTGSDVGNSELGGGAIVFKGKTLDLSSCVLEDNRVGSFPSYAAGGALYLAAEDVLITNCIMRNNHAGSEGGDMFIAAGKCTLKDCSIELADHTASNGRSIYAYENVELLRLDGCTIEGSVDVASSRSIYSLAQSAELVGNRFIDTNGSAATSMLFGSGGIVPLPCRIVLDGNIFIGNGGGGQNQGVFFSLSEASIIVEHNTLLDVYEEYSVNGGDGLSYRNNLVVGGSAWIRVSSGGAIECNDVWPDSEMVEVREGTFSRQDNISAEPLFCNPAGGDYRIAELSQCTEENAPEGCGLIGAFGVGCQQTPVKSMTWGQIKALFR